MTEIYQEDTAQVEVCFDKKMFLYVFVKHQLMQGISNSLFTNSFYVYKFI